MGNELSHPTSKAIAINQQWKTGDDLSSDDIVIPRLFLTQPATKLVMEGKANAGEIIDSENYASVAKRNEFAEILPIKVYSEWNRLQKLPGDTEWKKAGTVVVPPVPASGKKWTTEQVLEDNIPTQYKKTIKVFALNLKTPDAPLPYLITFKGFGANAGKAISSHFQLCAMAQTLPIQVAFNLSVGTATLDGKTQFCFECKKGRKTTAAEMEEATRWRGILTNAANVKIDEEDDDSGSAH